VNKLLIVLTIGITTAAYGFFNMPQQMMSAGSQMMFPAPEPQKCVCVCDVK